MIVRDSEWMQVRQHFSEVEKETLRTYVTGETICPQGFIISVEDTPTVKKLIEKLNELRGSSQ